MYTDSGDKKGYYFGHSLGGAQMTFAMMYDEARVQDSINKSILLAPCTVLSVSDPNQLEDTTKADEVGRLWKLGIHSTPTADWETDYATICSTYGEQVCNQYRNVRADNATWSTQKQEDHRSQNTIMNRYQKYIDITAWENGTYTSDLYDLT